MVIIPAVIERGQAHALRTGRPVPAYNLIRIWSMSLLCLITSVAAHAATLTLAWDPNREPDIAGYVVSWGTQSGVYPNSWNVGNTTIQQVTGLADGTTYYFVVTAYNTSGLMGLPSAEVSGQTGGSGVTCPTCGGGSDFNRDGKPDVVWLNDSTRQAVVWYLDGSQGNSFQGWDWLSSDWITGWTLVGVRDFNGNGKPGSRVAERCDAAGCRLVPGRLAREHPRGLQLAGPRRRRRLVCCCHGGLQRGRQTRFGVAERRSPSGGVVHGRSSRKYLPMVGLALVNASSRLARRRYLVTSTVTARSNLVWQQDWTRQAAIWYMGGSQGNTFLGRIGCRERTCRAGLSRALPTAMVIANPICCGRRMTLAR